jgi:hypothetical protein
MKLSINILCVAVVATLTTLSIYTAEATPPQHRRRSLGLRARDNFVPGCGACVYLEPRPGLMISPGNPKARFPHCCPSLKPASPTSKPPKAC